MAKIHVYGDYGPVHASGGAEQPSDVTRDHEHEHTTIPIPVLTFT